MVVIDSQLKAKKVQKEKPQASEDGRGFFVTSEDIEFRPMTMADIDDVMVIERTSYRFPWSTGFFLQELQVACARSIWWNFMAASSATCSIGCCPVRSIFTISPSTSTFDAGELHAYSWAMF
jgi:hypothetical protein